MATQFLDYNGATELLTKVSTWGHKQFAESDELDNLVKTVAYTEASGTFTVTYYDGSTATITLPTGSSATSKYALVKLYTATGSNTDGAYTQAALSKTATGSSGAALIGVEAVSSGTVSVSEGTLKAVLTSIAGLISTNKAGISTNATNISANTQSISNLEETIATLTGSGGTLDDYVKIADLAASSGTDGASLVGVAEISSGDIVLADSGATLYSVLNTIADYLSEHATSIATNTANIAKKVDKTTTVNGHALSGNVTVAAADLAYSNTVSQGGGASTTVANVKTALDTIITRVNANTEAVLAGLNVTVVTSLPTASASTMGTLYLVASSNGTSDSYNEYVTVSADKGDGTDSKTYSWEKLGSTGDLKLSDYWAQADLVAMTTSEVDALCNTLLT